MNPTPDSHTHALVALYNTPEINRITGFAEATALLSPEELATLYTDLRASAPSRHRRGLYYFEGRTGITSSGQYSSRREEHLAVALRNTFCRDRHLQLDNGQTLSLLDYQTPLKERRDDEGIGKVDLFGVIDKIVPCVIELKVPTVSGSVSDTPLRAFLEGLAYCAIIEANITGIVSEAEAKYGLHLQAVRPALCVMAPDSYWHVWFEHPKAGAWWPRLERLASLLGTTLGLDTHFLALRDAGFEMGLASKPPRLTGTCQAVSVTSLIAAADITGNA